MSVRFGLRKLDAPEGGSFFNLLNFLVNGSVMTANSAAILAQSIVRRKGAIQADVAQTQFIGRSSDNLCTVHATLPCKIFKIQLDEKIKKIPKKFRDYYIASATSDALQKARRVIYEEEEEIRKEYMTKIYEVLNREAGKESTLIEKFPPNSILLNPDSLIHNLYSLDEDMDGLYKEKMADLRDAENIDIHKLS